jgi:hypothetical protein
MTDLACYVAQAGMDEWDKTSIQNMCDEVGAETVYDFYALYGAKYGLYVDKILDFVEQIMNLEEEEYQ